MSKQPKALRLADDLDKWSHTTLDVHKAAAELRRLYEVNVELLEALKYARRMAHPVDCDIGFLAAAIAKAEREMK